MGGQLPPPAAVSTTASVLPPRITAVVKVSYGDRYVQSGDDGADSGRGQRRVLVVRGPARGPGLQCLGQWAAPQAGGLLRFLRPAAEAEPGHRGSRARVLRTEPQTAP